MTAQPDARRTVRPLSETPPWCAPPDGDHRALRSVLGRFATGITVLTSADGDLVHGMTANAFSSVSLDPPLVLVCVQQGALMLETIAANKAFGVSILSAGQEHLARYFASRARPAGRAQFDAVDWAPGPFTTAPLLSGAVAWLECELQSVHEGGDHLIFVGRVLSLGRGAEPDALLFFGGNYHRVGSSFA